MIQPLLESADIIRALLPAADIRTDQCDTIRVYHNRLFGGVRPLEDGRFKWSITDLDAPGPGGIFCITAPPFVSGVASSAFEAAQKLASAMLDANRAV